MRNLAFVRNTVSRIPFSTPWMGRRSLVQSMTSRLSLRPFHTLNPHQPLWEAYERDIPLKDRCCLHQLEKKWAEHQPFKGKTVLINLHLTRITLALVTALLKSGARVEITASPELVIHQNALQAVLAAQIPFLPMIPDDKKKGYYDVVYDCGAGMKDLTPNHGMAELTHTPADIYDHMKFPVITVDSSKTKVIETGLGTGDSFVRVIHTIARQSMAMLVLNWNHRINDPSPYDRLYLTTLLSLINTDQLFSQNKFMIFGFGKVGKGIACALESAGTPKKNIVVVDISSEAYMEAMKQGYSGLLLNHRISEHVEKIKAILPEMWAVVTATGVEQSISQYFSQSDFDRVALLANMSTGDDFGPRFAVDRILNHKKPANFMLDYPTEVMYLDAIFALFLKAGEELLTHPALKKGLNVISPALDQTMLVDWMAQHGESVWRHRLGRLQTETFMQHLRQNPALPLPDLARWVQSQGIFRQPLTPASTPDLKPLSHR
jgi:S-adenosylhomocysteine hydrolase